jgi:acyl-CoA hydrolase
MPANISDISGLVSSGLLPIDVVLLQVSGPDETGRYNAGLGIEHLHAAIGRARLVIAQVNPELPWTRGDTAIEPAAIDLLVSAAVTPIELPARPAGSIGATLPVKLDIPSPIKRGWAVTVVMHFSHTEIIQ